MKLDLLKYSFEQKLSHIPSALSMLDYVDVLFTDQFVVPYQDHIVIGKPFGAQAYYLVWSKLGFLDKIEELNIGVKHEEISFVDYSEETMGNALGVAAGIAMTTDKKVWVNLSDAALQMGNTLEAIQFIGHNNIKNIFVTVDYNNTQVTGKIDDILKVEPCINFFAEYGWFVQDSNGHDKNGLSTVFANLNPHKPNVIFCRTHKGNGVSLIQQNLKLWHYKKIESISELQLLS